MSEVREVEVALAGRAYQIRIGAGLLDDAASWAKLAGRQVLVVTDDGVGPRYAARAIAALGARATATHVMPAGEASKSLDRAGEVFAALAALGAQRDAAILALGGGVVGDLAGFAAACWMRGIDYVQAPTTLLAMVDSAVGGKTAVNVPAGKNLVGAFHQPRAVVADVDTLATLPEPELRAAFAEIVKYAAIVDAAFLDWLEDHAEALLARRPDALIEAIARSCAHKAAIVARDEHERADRALLNFGHTFGHALEHAAGYGALRHGEAVAIGMCAAARLSAREGLADEASRRRLEALLARFGLPIVPPPGLDPDALVATMRLDKKNAGGRLRLVLWRGVGRAFVADAVDPGVVRATLLEATTG